jgi:hypothetical protein
MPRRVFYSFHYADDCTRAAQVRNMGVVDGNAPATDNDWEMVTRGGDPAIEKWIKGQLDGKSCCLVLVGSNTAGRKWITYEIIEAWKQGKGVLGIYIHNLKGLLGQASKGSDPFDYVTFSGTQRRLSSIVKCYDPPYTDSKQVYAYIRDGLAGWFDEALQIRAEN